MRAGAAFAVLVAVLSLAEVVAQGPAAGWSDPANTGEVPFAGPAHDDVSWIVHLPARRAGSADPIILGDAVYVLSTDAPFGDARGDPAIWRIGLEDASVSRLTDVASWSHSWATDGTGFYVAADDGVHAHRVSDGEELWWATTPPVVAEQFAGICAFGKVVDGNVYFFCAALGAPADAAGPAIAAFYGAVFGERGEDIAAGARNATQIAEFVQAIDAENGASRWTWIKRDEAGAGRAQPGVVSGGVPTGMAILDGQLFAASLDLGGSACTLRAHALADGARAWEVRSDPPTPDRTGLEDASACGLPSEPTASAGAVFVKFRRLHAVNAARGTITASSSVGARDLTTSATGSGMALGPDALFVASSQVLYRFDRDPESLAEEENLLVAASPNEAFRGSHLLLDMGGTLYLQTRGARDPDAVAALYAVDGATMTTRWRHALTPTNVSAVDNGWALAAAPGLVVAASSDGEVRLLGRTAASLRVALGDVATYPGPGEEVVVGLAASAPGRFGPPTRFRADWGDGRVDDWRPDPVLRHAYNATGDRTARFSVANDAGQTASEVVVFHVGAPRPNLVSQAFSPERQNVTFFLIGLAVTVAGAGIGVARLARRRALLRREIAAVDAIPSRMRGSAVVLDTAIAERRSHAYALLAARRLDESQYQVLERHIDAVARSARLGVVDERLRFLPHGMVLDLHDMLGDGRVTSVEYRHFVELLERDADLTAEQRERVRAIVDGWYAHDRGGARS
ncbi:MAG TPA: hypothetical protein VI997_05810 [Candidatus Thermoplasmatota archaeon]|nr:hypothetical protein [Candidatus Thermoplasmatota archaeon]